VRRISKLLDLIKHHETLAYFLLTYAFSWILWKAFDRLYLSGQIIALPFIMLGMFGPGLVSILLSAVIHPGPKQNSRKTALIAFVAAWLPATLLITLDQVLNEDRSAIIVTVIVSAAAALMPAFVVSSIFSRVPGIKRHLASLAKPRGSAAYYLLALILFTAIWLLGVLLNRALGLQVPQRAYPAAAANIGLFGAVALSFFYNFLPNGLSEEVGWRGFALPRFQARRSPLVASLILWMFWAIWHAPAYFGGFAAQSPADTLVEWMFMLPVAIVFTWFYNRAKGTILVTALLHPAMNTATRFLPITIGGIMLLVAFVVFAVVSDRMWRVLSVGEKEPSRAAR